MKVQYQGIELEAINIEMLTKDERFNTYRLSDGHVLKVKEVLTGIHRLDGITNPDGTPAYIFQAKRVIRIT